MTHIQKTVAFIFGIVFLLVGILGFVPALTPNMSLLGLFMVNPLHSIVHLAFGVLGIAAALTETGVLYNRIGGLIYLVLGILGFFPFLYFGSNMLIGLVMINPADNFLHIVIGIVLAGVGFFVAQPRRAATA